MLFRNMALHDLGSKRKPFKPLGLSLDKLLKMILTRSLTSMCLLVYRIMPHGPSTYLILAIPAGSTLKPRLLTGGMILQYSPLMPLSGAADAM